MSKYRRMAYETLEAVAVLAVALVVVLVVMGAVHFVTGWFMGVGQ